MRGAVLEASLRGERARFCNDVLIAHAIDTQHSVSVIRPPLLIIYAAIAATPPPYATCAAAFDAASHAADAYACHAMMAAIFLLLDAIILP